MQDQFDKQLRQAFKEIGLNTVRDWQRLAKEFVNEMNTNKTKLGDIEPYFDAWLVNIEHNLIANDIYDPIVIDMVKELFEGFSKITPVHEEKVIKFDLFGSKFCIGKEHDKMFIRSC